MKKNILNNSEGVLTVDYMFAIVLAMGFMVILFSLSMTLTMVDVVQYMTFSSARVYSVANISEKQSKIDAKKKFIQLFSNKSIKPIFDKAKWFAISEPIIGSLQEDFPASSEYKDVNTFYGVSVQFNAKMLDIKIPFYGSTNSRDDGEGFTSEIHSFLGREPSTQECQALTAKRLEWLYQFYNNANLKNSLQEYKIITDNGC